MSITVTDIKLLQSAVMADVPEGGGAATGIEVVDGLSNNLFPDLSTLDAAYGAVNARKVFAGVRTDNRDALYGVGLAVLQPPTDPKVSALLFDTDDAFDVRTDAQSRIESYLTRGPEYPGLLFGDFIAGMSSISLLQRTNVPLPAVGTTLMLISRAGTASERLQYVRITDVSAIEREFAIPGQEDKTFKRLQVNLSLSDTLRSDFPGCTPADSYRDSTIDWAASGKTRTYDTVVADAARYYGCKPLAQPVVFNAQAPVFTVDVGDIFESIIPSAQIETPLADARPNQQTAAVVPTGASIVQTLTLAFTTTQQLYVGGGILPGSLSVQRSGLTLTDANGRLYNGPAEVGAIDYANGILSLSSNVFGTSAGAHVISYTPAAVPTVVSRSVSIPVTAQSQRLSYVITLDPIPAAGSLQLSYLSGGRWYVLSDEGTGALTGGATGLGAGTINPNTGTVSATLGALPDVGSRIILVWAPVAAQGTVSAGALDLSGRVHADTMLQQSFKPGGLTLTWQDGALQRTASDNGAGALQGDAAGRCWYGSGRLQFSPHVLPAPGTVISYSLTAVTAAAVVITSFGDAGASWTIALPSAPVKPLSLELTVITRRSVRRHPGEDADKVELMRLLDDGAGNVYVQTIAGNLPVGTIHYGTGVVTLPKTVAGYVERQGNWERKVPFGGHISDPAYIAYTGDSSRSVALTFLGSAASLAIGDGMPSWAWWSTAWGAGVARARYGGSDGAVMTGSFLLSELSLAIGAVEGRGISAVRFELGTDRYSSSGYTLVRNTSPATGEGEDTGAVSSSRCTLSGWQAGAAPAVTNARIGTSPATFAGNLDLLLDAAVFRTAAAPVKPGALAVTGKWDDGTVFSVSADLNGVINSGGVFGVVDYQTGVAECRFGTLVAAPSNPLAPPTGVVDLSYLGISGVQWVKLRSVQADTLRYGATAYSYIPLDADILGLDPVRLPSDGRVPIYRKGSVVVIHHTGSIGPATVAAGQTLSTGRQRLAHAEFVGANGARILTGYTANLDAGTVTVTDTTGWAQPVTLRHRVEDMRVCAEVQITGQLRMTAPLTHDFPAGTLVSSLLLIGLVQSRVSLLQDQESWTGVWSDDVIGNAAAGQYDAINAPPVVTNRSAVTERWRITFTSSTAFACYGEHFGLVGTGTINSDFAPLNPATGQPYFRMLATGWGGGWSLGNTVRINTVGALPPAWVARVIKPGAGTVGSDSFSIGILGDIDTP